MAQSGPGQGKKNIGIVFALAAIGVAAYVLYTNLRGAGLSDPNTTTYVDSENGKSFRHRNVAGEDIPIVSPYSGKNTGYPGVPCYWTADGHVKTDPTWVLLNDFVGKPGPTFCPDCGRLVDRNTPPPGPGSAPPPTQSEWVQTHSGRN